MTRRKIIPYDPNLKELARQLRRNSTLAEVLLWNHLKKRQMRGYQFLRQKPLDNYIVDFFCYELMLAIEIDDDSHDYREEKDLRRQQRLESFGVTFLRFADVDVKRNMEGVLQSIEMRINELEEHPSLKGGMKIQEGRNTPLRPPQGGNEDPGKEEHPPTPSLRGE